MTAAQTLLHALTRGLATALPISQSGHTLVLQIWVGGEQLDAVSLVAEIGCLAALVVAVRRRLLRAFSEGVRGLARPALLRTSDGGRDALALALAVMVAAVTELLLRPYAQGANQVPLVAAGGLLLTAAALISTAIAPSPTRLTPNPTGALICGLGFGLSVMPGASAVAIAFAIMRWLGVAHVRAAEMALSIAVFVLGLRVLRNVIGGGAGGGLASTGDIALSVVAAFVGASLGANWWRALCERQRTPRLALWLVPLGLALLSYGRALNG